MHSIPGGLCTAWKRKGYTIDGCVHWLMGSSPQDDFYRYWQEVGIAQGREFVNADECVRFECAAGRTLIFYTNMDRLEKYLLELSPQDAEPIVSVDSVRIKQVVRYCQQLIDPLT